MKNTRKGKSNGSLNGTSRHVVQVKFSHPEAKAVSIAGTFNDWRPEVTPMFTTGEGQWRKELLLPPGTYEYLFVADGEWLTDPMANKTVANPFGGRNSIMLVHKHGPAGCSSDLQ